MGKRCSVEDFVDKFRWGWITVSGDTESGWGLNFLFVKGKNSAGDDLSIATSLGITLLDSNGDNPLSYAGDNLPKSTGDDSPNSTGEAFSDCAGKNFRLRWGYLVLCRGIFLYSVGEY